jgi:hypothetical protein
LAFARLQRGKIKLGSTTVYPEWLSKVNLADWIRDEVESNKENMSEDERQKLIAFSYPPPREVETYNAVKAYGNHFRVSGDRSDHFKTYDSGIPCTFQIQNRNGGTCEVSHVGELMEIINIRYEQLDENFMIMNGRWVDSQWHDAKGRPATMKFDEAGLLMANFAKMKGKQDCPYVWPLHVQQIFFWPHGNNGWRHVLHKEARARRRIAEVNNMVQDGVGDNVVVEAAEAV